jgi:hypothetical protein
MREGFAGFILPIDPGDEGTFPLAVVQVCGNGFAQDIFAAPFES